MTDSNTTHNPRSRRVRFAPAALLGAAAASAVIALSMNGTLAGFVAKITNDNNTAATGSLAMEETNSDGSVICRSNATDATTNAATCSTINKYGGSTTMVPGTPVATTIKIKNIGSTPANTFTLAPGTCTPSTSGSVSGTANDICTKMQLSLTQDGTPVVLAPTNQTTVGLNTIANSTITLAGPVAPGATVTFVFTVNLPTQNTAQNTTADNAYQGLKVSQNLVWQFTS